MRKFFTFWGFALRAALLLAWATAAPLRAQLLNGASPSDTATSQAMAYKAPRYITLAAGGVAYKGDLVQRYERFGPSLYASLRFNKNKRFNGEFFLTWGRTTAQNFDYNPRLDLGGTPNRFFQTSYFSAGYALSLNLLNRPRYRLYLSQGYGIAGFSTQDAQGQDLLGKQETRADGETYNTFTNFFPTTIGLVWYPYESIGVGARAGFMHPTNDYLDNIGELSNYSGIDNLLTYQVQVFIPLRLGRDKSPEKPGKQSSIYQTDDPFASVHKPEQLTEEERQEILEKQQREAEKEARKRERRLQRLREINKLRAEKGLPPLQIQLNKEETPEAPDPQAQLTRRQKMMREKMRRLNKIRRRKGQDTLTLAEMQERENEKHREKKKKPFPGITKGDGTLNYTNRDTIVSRLQHQLDSVRRAEAAQDAQTWQRWQRQYEKRQQERRQNWDHQDSLEYRRQQARQARLDSIRQAMKARAGEGFIGQSGKADSASQAALRAARRERWQRKDSLVKARNRARQTAHQAYIDSLKQGRLPPDTGQSLSWRQALKKISRTHQHRKQEQKAEYQRRMKAIRED